MKRATRWRSIDLLIKTQEDSLKRYIRWGTEERVALEKSISGAVAFMGGKA